MSEVRQEGVFAGGKVTFVDRSTDSCPRFGEGGNPGRRRRASGADLGGAGRPWGMTDCGLRMDEFGLTVVGDGDRVCET